MEHYRTISLQLFRPNEKAVFTSLLSLLSFRTADSWEMVEDTTSDVSVVDVDTPEGNALADDLEQHGHCVVRFSANAERSSAHHRLSKPLRAADILRCLNELEEMDIAGDVAVSGRVSAPVHVTTTYRLRRWPNKQTLSAYPAASRLCAVFLKQHITVDHAASMVNLPKSDVEAFVSACQAQQLITEQTESAPTVVKQSDRQVSKNAGLFEKLRMKFSVRA